MTYETYKTKHSGTGCTECAWGSAMATIIQNETINNASFRSRLMKDLQATNIRIMKDGRLLSFDA